MSSARITAYCTRQDLHEWLAILMATKDLSALPMTYGDDRPKIVTEPTSLVLGPEIRRVFLFPRDAKKRRVKDMNDVKSRLWGWVDCTVGGLKQHAGTLVLTESNLVGEDFDVEDVHPARFVRSLKRRLAKSTKAGVRAVGTDVVYKSTRYTKAAEQLWHEGVLWKQQPTHRPAFEPYPPSA